MTKYRKKPVIVEAEQWWPGRVIKGVMYEACYVQEDLDGERQIKQGPYVTTIQGENVRIHPGDWIITESDGVHQYPCDPSVFAATYDAVGNDQ